MHTGLVDRACSDWQRGRERERDGRRERARRVEEVAGSRVLRVSLLALRVTHYCLFGLRARTPNSASLFSSRLMSYYYLY